MHAPVRELRFSAFTLDLLRCVVRRGNEELPLRPQSFDVLRYLAERPGRIVSKEELFAAIWPGATVTDDSLVQCIRDIRQALGDSSRQIVKAVPKRGYLLQPPLPEDAAGAATAQASRQRRSCCRKRSLSVFWGPASSARGTGCRVLSRPAC
jgi:DNA-binding winged helix-turn-helix (wHTH) protein